MIEIHYSKCMGCGNCVKDCFPHALSMQDRQPILSEPQNCIACGHCVAVCPANAVSIPTLNMAEAVTPKEEAISPAALLEAMTMRRSCRHFTAEPVTDAEIHMLLDAGRHCPTAKNLQGTSYIVVRQQVANLRRAAITALGQAGEAMLRDGCPQDMVRRAKNFIEWEARQQEDPTFDPLFFHAPLLILVFSPAEGIQDAAAATAYMELLAHCMRLGCLYSGYFCAAAAQSQELKQLLQISPEHQLVRCLVVGHPAIRFKRAAPKKPARFQEL